MPNYGAAWQVVRLGGSVERKPFLDACGQAGVAGLPSQTQRLSGCRNRFSKPGCGCISRGQGVENASVLPRLVPGRLGELHGFLGVTELRVG